MTGAERRLARERLLKSQEGKCLYCRCPLIPANATLEHVKPLAHGGTWDWKNLAVACKECNELKGSLTKKWFKRLLKGQVEPKPWMKAAMWEYSLDGLRAAQIRRKIFLRADRACERIRRATA